MYCSSGKRIFKKDFHSRSKRFILPVVRQKEPRERGVALALAVAVVLRRCASQSSQRCLGKDFLSKRRDQDQQADELTGLRIAASPPLHLDMDT